MSNLHADIAEALDAVQAIGRYDLDPRSRVDLQQVEAKLKTMLICLPSPAPAERIGTDSDGSERGAGGDEDRRPGGKSNDRHL